MKNTNGEKNIENAEFLEYTDPSRWYKSFYWKKEPRILHNSCFKRILCPLLYFCFKRNSSFCNVLRPSLWRCFIFLLSQSFVSVFHFELSSPFWTEKNIQKNYLKWWFKLSADSFSGTLSFPHCMLELMKYNGEFVFMTEKKFHLLLKFQKTFSSPG